MKLLGVDRAIRYCWPNRSRGYEDKSEVVLLGILLLVQCAARPAAGREAQDNFPSNSNIDPNPVIIVQGRRGSVIDGIAPTSEIDRDAIEAIGADSMDGLRQAIRGQTQSPDGSDPIFLLNGQRVADYQEIGSLPPEAIAKVEVLPEVAALRFGLPPTRRVVNFITKRRFNQLEADAAAGTTLPTGRATQSAGVGYTRLRGDGRLTMNLEYSRSDTLLQSEREIPADPDVPFDEIGNVTAAHGTEIDPDLSNAAGQMVTIVPVPADPTERGNLADYALAANQPRLFAPGAYATLSPANHALKGEAVLGGPVGRTLGGSLGASFEHSLDRTLEGPAAAQLLVPAGNPFSPFSRAVVVNRYLTETDPLRQREAKTTVKVAATLRGAIAGWQWDVTGSVSQATVRSLRERGIDLATANLAIAAGADPFLPLGPTTLGARQTDRSLQRTRAIETKLVAAGSPLSLPAGPVTIAATVEGAWLSAKSALVGYDSFDLRLARTRIEGGLTFDLPLTSRGADVLSLVGDFSINGSAYLRRVQDFGSLHDSTLGFTWTPLDGVQLLANRRHSEAAPDLARQSMPPGQVENVPVFDYASGRTEVVTLLFGGNPHLLAEERRVTSLSLNIKPFAKSQLRLGANYEVATIRNQTGTVLANTPKTEALMPELFDRDASGRLTSVSFRPVNFYLEKVRKLQLSLTASGKIGRPPETAPEGAEAAPDTRHTYFMGIVPTFSFEDSIQLRPGTPVLDLLSGDSIGTYTPRLAGYAYGGINREGYGANVSVYYGGPRRTRSDNPSSDLKFSAVLKLGLAVYLPVQSLLAEEDWARELQLRLEIENVLDSRQRVRDRNGDSPYRYQSDFLDPIGRTITVSLRKRI